MEKVSVLALSFPRFYLDALAYDIDLIPYPPPDWVDRPKGKVNDQIDQKKEEHPFAPPLVDYPNDWDCRHKPIWNQWV